MLVCEGSLCPIKLLDVSGPDLGEAGRYMPHSISTSLKQAIFTVGSNKKRHRGFFILKKKKDRGGEDGLKSRCRVFA